MSHCLSPPTCLPPLDLKSSLSHPLHRVCVHLVPLLRVATASETECSRQCRLQGVRYNALALQYQVFCRLLVPSTRPAHLGQSQREPGPPHPGSQSPHACLREEPAGCRVVVPRYLFFGNFSAWCTPSEGLIDALALHPSVPTAWMSSRSALEPTLSSLLSPARLCENHGGLAVLLPGASIWCPSPCTQGSTGCDGPSSSLEVCIYTSLIQCQPMLVLPGLCQATNL